MTRTTVNPTTATLTRKRHWITNNPGPADESLLLSNTAYNYHQDSRDDIHRSAVTQGFRQPLSYLASGRNRSSANVNYSGFYPTDNWGGGEVQWSISGRSANSVDRLVDPSTAAVNLIPASDITRAIVNMLRAVGDQKWSAGQMIVEMQGAIDTIGGAAYRLQNAMIAASRKDWKGIARALSVPPKRVKNGASAADGWLQYQFGWAPLVDDIAHSALFLSGHLDRRDVPIIMARSHLSNQQTSQSAVKSFGDNPGSAYGNVTTLYYDKTTLSDTWKASIYYELDVSWLNGLSRYGLIGLSTPWAVVPFSFIADWILPIGDLLEAWDATIGLRYKGGSYTRFWRRQISRQFAGFTADPRLHAVGAVYWDPADAYGMSRTPWSSSPLPFPAYIKNPFSTFKAVTSIALFKQFK